MSWQVTPTKTYHLLSKRALNPQLPPRGQGAQLKTDTLMLLSFSNQVCALQVSWIQTHPGIPAEERIGFPVPFNRHPHCQLCQGPSVCSAPQNGLKIDCEEPTWTDHPGRVFVFCFVFFPSGYCHFLWQDVYWEELLAKRHRSDRGLARRGGPGASEVGNSSKNKHQGQQQQAYFDKFTSSHSLCTLNA